MKLIGNVYISKGRATLNHVGVPLLLFCLTLTKNWGIALIKREQSEKIPHE